MKSPASILLVAASLLLGQSCQTLSLSGKYRAPSSPAHNVTLSAFSTRDLRPTLTIRLFAAVSAFVPGGARLTVRRAPARPERLSEVSSAQLPAPTNWKTPLVLWHPHVQLPSPRTNILRIAQIRMSFDPNQPQKKVSRPYPSCH